MSNDKKHTEKTAAESKSIGFDYQYYFFLWKVLLLQPNESVGLEVKDDVHTDLSNNHQVLYQLKHTIKKNADGSLANLTTSDLDMWKTFSNWSKVISDKNDSRSIPQAQLSFVEKTSFVLASNKSSNESNKVVLIIRKLQIGTKNENDVRTYFQSLATSTKNKDLKSYVKDVLNLAPKVLEQFLLNTFFHLDDDDILTKCKEAIKSKMIPQEKIDQAFMLIDSRLRADNFLQIKDGVKLEISFNEFYIKYRRYFDIFRNSTLIVQEYKGVLPDKLEYQIFIKQLLEIGFVESDDFEYISRLTSFKLKLLNNLEDWKREGEITDLEIKRFKENAFTLWDNEFRLQNMGTFSEEEYNNKGIEVLRSVLKHSFNLVGQELDIDMCNGKFYSLSDEPIIGWRKDWKKYKK
ncbi:hypothetical protein [Aquiflexum gelatinilyticum]|uniref:CD-NTase associated protein 4-like DNA endonuclease domain-containing protein n=1 Tax=Aquiflexum gelatinilyticum TaxID=2961943 RepID=A0A9X2T3B9_9BACT|nr:hypothetical protein [Aquiflexum gelatinilyticum]MCR9017511.1 hypothetical protein [Aquiflexum gelatinilyticum]